MRRDVSETRDFPKTMFTKQYNLYFPNAHRLLIYCEKENFVALVYRTVISEFSG